MTSWAITATDASVRRTRPIAFMEITLASARSAWRSEKNAAELHASLHRKLLSLPGEVEICPAHFAGSACGAGLSGKPSSTVAFEKRWNPMLGADQATFVSKLSAQPLVQPPGMQEIVRFNQGRA